MTAKARATAKATEDYVRANTWLVMGMAALAGLVVGIFAVRRGLPAIEEGRRVVSQALGIRDDGQGLKDQ